MLIWREWASGGPRHSSRHSPYSPSVRLTLPRRVRRRNTVPQARECRASWWMSMRAERRSSCRVCRGQPNRRFARSINRASAWKGRAGCHGAAAPMSGRSRCPGRAGIPASQPYHRSLRTSRPINTFSDRITNCLHSFPLNAGLGNNPTERDFYVRSCANR